MTHNSLKLTSLNSWILKYTIQPLKNLIKANFNLLSSEVQVNNHKKIRELSHHMLTIREEEKKRLARILHDEIGQALTVLKMDIDWIQKHNSGDNVEMISQRTNQMSKLLSETVSSVRQISQELRPVLLDQVGLVAALEWLLENYQDRSMLECEFCSNIDYVHIPQNTSIAIYRILQEALCNIYRHASATAVHLNILEESEVLTITISDNGCGIKQVDLEKITALGMMSMKEQALLNDITLDINGSNEGTNIFLSIPLETNT